MRVKDPIGVYEFFNLCVCYVVENLKAEDFYPARC